MSFTLAEPRAAVLGDDAPWRTGDLLRAIGLAAAGLTGLALTWYGASDQPDWPDQLPWASLGVAATTVALLGLVSWLVAGLRRVRRLRGSVLPSLQAQVGAMPRRSAGAAAVTPIGTAVVTAPGMTRFHRPACPLAAGKPVQPVRPDEADGAGLVPCGVCAA